MGLRFMSLSSGSSGNCYYIGNDRKSPDHHGILIDAGVSLRTLKMSLAKAGLSTDSFGAVLVTHDHWDHVRNLGSYVKRLRKPVWATRLLHDTFSERKFCYPYMQSCRHDLSAGTWNDICGFRVRYFEVPHDATQTVGYVIEACGCRFVLMTDMGRMTDEAMGYAKTADTVVIESNYDREMLRLGPYPEELQDRIRGGHGHLSNDECAAAIEKLWHPGLRNLFLCHLSENNNTHDKATESARAALEAVGGVGTVRLLALPRTSPTPLFEL